MIADPPLREFAELIGRPDGRIDLARAALAIARWEYPGLDVDAYLDRLDGLARGVDGARRSTDPLGRLHRHSFLNSADGSSVYDDGLRSGVCRVADDPRG